MAGRKGQSTVEFILAFGAILLPMTFMLIFVSQLLWVWHSVNEFTREGASYASSHCWESSGQNVVDFMRANVPPMVMGDQVQSGPAQISVAYFSQDDTGQLAPYSGGGDCSTSCVPDVVTVSISGFQFGSFLTSVGLPPITVPNLQASLPMESAGFNADTPGACVP